MKCKIILFYKDEDALLNYLLRFRCIEPEAINKRHNEWRYDNDGFSICCIRGLSENARGHKADIVCIQEELTWKENWPDLRDCILRPMLLSPIDIQVFDGISPEDAQWRAERQ